VYVPIDVSGRTLNFQASDKFAATPGAQNFGLNTAAFGAQNLAKPPNIGPVRDFKGGGTTILSAWDPVTQKERWFADGGGQRFGGAVSTAANLVFQVTPQGRLRAYTADKGDRLLDIAVGETAGLGPPITYMHNGKQYVAVMGGQGTVGGSNGLPAPAPARGAAPAPPPAPSRGAAQTQEPTLAAPPRGAAPPPLPGGRGPAPANPRLFVFALP
jgi:hypothetical protein